MADKCPYCFRNLNPNTWQKDPILIPNGAKYKWQNDTTLIEDSDIEKRLYKGIYQITEPEVQEIQDALKALEEEHIEIADRTEFSPLNTTGLFQITGKHIKEMRDSVEKVLTAIGSTKDTYFNYDEDGNQIIQPNGNKTDWTDPITEDTDLVKFQVKYIHIEDLRHYIRYIWKETWDYDNIHPLINQVDSWNSQGGGFWGYETQFFPYTPIFGTQEWLVTYHVAHCYLYPFPFPPATYRGTVNYSFIQTNGFLTLYAHTTTPSEAFSSLVDYNLVFYTPIQLTIVPNAKLKLEGVLFSSSGTYMVVLKVSCVFIRQIWNGTAWVTTTPISKIIVLVSYAGTQAHIEGTPFNYIDDGKVWYNDASGNPPSIGAIPGYNIATGVHGLIDMLNYEYGLSEQKPPAGTPPIIGIPYITSIHVLSMYLDNHVFGNGVGKSSTINWSIDNIKLVA